MTIAALLSDLTTLVTTPMDATSIPWSELAEALTTDHRIPPNEARVQVSASVARQDRADSNQAYLEVEAIVRLIYRADTEARQTAWLDTHLYNLAVSLLPPSAWAGLASVYEVVGGPEAGAPEREDFGDVISQEIVTRVLLTP